MLPLTHIHWSQSEEATLIHRREGDHWAYKEIAAELPLRSILACRLQYNKITVRILEPADRAKLVRLWET